MTKTQVSEKVSALKNLHLQEDQYIEAQFPLICLNILTDLFLHSTT